MAYTMYRNNIKASLLDTERENELSIQEQHNYWDNVLANNLFVICKTPMARAITIRTLCGFRKVKINTHSFDDLLNQITNKADKGSADLSVEHIYVNLNFILYLLSYERE